MTGRCKPGARPEPRCCRSLTPLPLKKECFRDHLWKIRRSIIAQSWLAAQPGSSANGVRKALRTATDRKSTRLNSSHQIISYAVFCLKKKKNYILAFTTD